jgi:hypothetical protein
VWYRACATGRKGLLTGSNIHKSFAHSRLASCPKVRLQRFRTLIYNDGVCDRACVDTKIWFFLFFFRGCARAARPQIASRAVAGLKMSDLLGWIAGSGTKNKGRRAFEEIFQKYTNFFVDATKGFV